MLYRITSRKTRSAAPLGCQAASIVPVPAIAAVIQQAPRDVSALLERRCEMWSRA